MHETAKRKITHDDVRIGSMQYDNIYGGELTASEFTLDAVRLKSLYIVFDFSFITFTSFLLNIGDNVQPKCKGRVNDDTLENAIALEFFCSIVGV
jgi:hypothetical protein